MYVCMYGCIYMVCILRSENAGYMYVCMYVCMYVAT